MSGTAPELAPLDRSTLVEASAGTGKTYTITTYFVRAILEDGLTPEKILVVTYTKAATAELRARTRGRILQALAHLSQAPEAPDALYEVVKEAVARTSAGEVERRLRGALGQMDQAAIFTIHGFCQRLLQEHPLSFGVDLDLEVAENPASLSSALAVDYWASELYDRPAWFLQALRERKVSTARLTRLANSATVASVHLVGPEPCEILEGEVQRVSELLREAGTIWATKRSEALERLLVKELNKQRYNEKRVVEKWAPELDAFFASGSIAPLPKFFEWLCASRIKVKKNAEPPRHPFFDACEAAFEAHAALEPKLDYAVFAFQRQFFDYVREQSRRRRDETGVFSFDDLLTTVHAAVDPELRGEALPSARSIAQTVRAAYPLALVDEFQDTDSVQYGIFRSVYGQGSAIYVGDPKQAIYAFRGADVHSYLEAKADIGENKLSLETNRRSDPGVVQGVNTLFGRRARPFIIEGIGFQPVLAHETQSNSTLRPRLDIVFLDSEHFTHSGADHVAEVAANEVALLLESGAQIRDRAMEAGDIAILCRTNEQTTAVVRALRELNVPVSLDGGTSVLDTEVAGELWAMMEAVSLPGDSFALRRALLTSLVGLTPLALASMRDDAWSMWVDRFRAWHEQWRHYGVLRFIESMLVTTGAETRIASRPTARRDLTDLLHVQELLLRGQRAKGRDPVSLIQWFRRLQDGSAADAGISSEDLLQRPDAQSGAVRVSTIHRSKGLEYGVVLCPFTWGGGGLRSSDSWAVKYYDEERGPSLDLGSADKEEHLALSKEEARSEALRLLYVATTRAKHQCTLFWGQGFGWKDSALAYLLHGPGDLKSLDEAAIVGDIEELVAESGGSAGWRRPRGERAAPRLAEACRTTLEARTETRGFDHSPRIASFTSLTGHEETSRPHVFEETTSPLFAELPGGARTGLLLHAIFEHVAIDELDDSKAEAEINRQLGLFGFDRSLAEPTIRDLGTVVSTPILGEPALPSLAELDRERQLRELEFTLTLGRPKLHDLVELLRKQESPRAATAYHELLALAGDHTLRGLLRGFIDLMYQWEGRRYVPDYKSNRHADYGAASVAEAVQRDHYVLQGLLYAAAANRYLRQRDHEYDAKEHWGGTLFLFLRGMEGPANAGRSVFFDRQTPELVDALDDWLGGGDGPH